MVVGFAAEKRCAATFGNRRHVRGPFPCGKSRPEE
jgi:hypothetical protein